MRFFRRNRLSEYRGYLDSTQGGRVSGWVWNRFQPRQRPIVEIHAAGTLVGTVRADALRDDLLRSKIGDGRYGFSFDLPAGAFSDETIAAKVAAAEFWLLNSSGRKELDPLAAGLMNSMRRGLPLLRPGLSQRSVDEFDIDIAAELQKQWRSEAGKRARTGSANRRTMWGQIVAERHHVLAQLLNGADPRPLAAHLVDLQKLPETDGLTQGHRAYRDFMAASPEGRRAAVAPFQDMLASLAQYIGVEHAECAEQDYVGATLALDQERLAGKIEAALGHAIAPPVVFDGLYGLAIGDRILHGRDIQALYAALRAIEASDKAEPAICEIGAGLGQAAYYAWLRGVRRYSIVDLPTVCAMQYFYLRKTLPQTRVSFREAAEPPSHAEGIDLIFASTLGAALQLRSDIVLNCDSFPEMGDEICGHYFSRIGGWAPLLLSINQEANRPGGGPGDRQTVVSELLPKYGFVRRYQFRSWVRRGYVEELWASPEPR